MREVEKNDDAGAERCSEWTEAVPRLANDEDKDEAGEVG
jgi:hypothetical protein